MHLDESRLYGQLGAEIRALRKQSQMSQDELAVATQVERTSITNIEAGRQKPPLHVIFRLCMALHVQPHDLLPRLEEVCEKEMVEVANGAGVTVLPPLAASVVSSIRSEEQ
ncbi:MAG TPA: helix-turn-helix transcriptional regulator [Fimbriimonas sp.]|nr:helix-turn-helix transcriptional regulator [Fimbriimonas sp.]